jgi:hypothetical protein
MKSTSEQISQIVNEQDISYLLRVDDVFVTIYGLYGSPPNWNRPQGFTTLAKIILEQQVSLQSANAHLNKLKAILPSSWFSCLDRLPTGMDFCMKEPGCAKHIHRTVQTLRGWVHMFVYDTDCDLMGKGIIHTENILPEIAIIKLSWTPGQTSDLAKSRRSC